MLLFYILQKILFQQNERIFENLHYEVALVSLSHVRWVPYHHGMARPKVADGGESLQIWRVAANMLNKQSGRADRGWSSSSGIGRGARKRSP
jgi:hypothetical protein